MYQGPLLLQQHSNHVILNISGARRSWRKEATAEASSSFLESSSVRHSSESNCCDYKPATRGTMVSFKGGCSNVESSNIISESTAAKCSDENENKGSQNNPNGSRNSTTQKHGGILSGSETVPSSSHADCLPSATARKEYSTSSTQVSTSGGTVVTRNIEREQPLGPSDEISRALGGIGTVDQDPNMSASSVKSRIRLSNLSISDFFPGDVSSEVAEELDSNIDTMSGRHHRMADDGAFIFSTH